MAVFSFDQQMAIATLVATIIVSLITIAAIIFSPLIALRLQKDEDNLRDVYKRQLNIFKSLMATRAARVSAEHCYALNMIDIEFYGCRKILIPWSAYKQHLNTILAGQSDEAAKDWLNQGNDLLMDLLSEISTYLNLHFSKSDLNGVYFPRALGEYENDQRLLRKGLIEIIEGKQAISMNVISLPKVE